LNSTQYELLLAHLLRLPSLLENALTQGENLIPMEEGCCREIWEAACLYAKAAGKPVAPSPALLSSDMNPDTRKVLDLLYAIPDKHLDEDSGRMLLKQAGIRKLRRQISAGMSNAHTKEDIESLLDKGKEGLLSVDGPVAGGKLVNMLDDPEGFTKDMNYQPMYLDFFDFVSDGGLMPGEICVLMGPTGGGKTLMGTQLTTSLAMNERTPLYMSYEQGLAGDIFCRLATQILGIDGTCIRGRHFSNWPAEVRAQFREVMPMYKDNHFAVDMTLPESGASQGHKAIEAHVARMCEMGKTPSLVVLDWLLPLLTQVVQVSSSNVNLDNEKLRIYAQVLMKNLKTMAEKHGVPVMLLHQLNADLARAAASRKPKATDSQEIRTLANLADVVMIIGNRDPRTNVCRFLSDKNRRGPLLETFLRMNGPRCRFEVVDDMEINHAGKIVKKVDGGLNEAALEGEW